MSHRTCAYKGTKCFKTLVSLQVPWLALNLILLNSRHGIKISVAAGPRKKPKMYHFHTKREEDLFFFFFSLYIISEVYLLHQSVYHRNSNEGECGVVFSKCSKKLEH